MTLSDIVETNNVDELDFLMQDSSPAGQYVQDMAAKLAAQHNLDATDDHDQVLQLVMDQIRQEVGEPVSEEHEWQKGFADINKADAYFRSIAHERGMSPVQLYGKGDAEQYRRYLKQFVKSKPASEGQHAEIDEARMPLEGHAYHDKSDAELRYIMKDAGEAARAMRDHDPAAESKYLDQVNDAATVLWYRKRQQGVAEGLGKSIKRSLAGWGAFDKDKPADVVNRVRGQDTDTLKGLSRTGPTGKGSPAELQQKAISRELKKRAALSAFAGVAESDTGPFKFKDLPMPGKQYQVGDRVKYRSKSDNPYKLDQGKGEGVVQAFNQGRYIVDGNPVYPEDIIGPVATARPKFDPIWEGGTDSDDAAAVEFRAMDKVKLNPRLFYIFPMHGGVSKPFRSEEEARAALVELTGYDDDDHGYVVASGQEFRDSEQGVSEAQTCNMSEDGTMCPEHGLAECGMSECADPAQSHQEQDPIEGLKSLLGRFRA
jgi:hypothetical protein